jgi:hypothetical protein
MASDVNDIITVKQLLNNSIVDIHNNYIKNILGKTIKDCNLLYTQVCYLIKLFLLYDYETNKGIYNDYVFNELFIRNCFKLVKTGKINKLTNFDDENNIINRLEKFYNNYNSNHDNKIKFIKPDDVSSITHITDALSRDIQTNITNNIILNYDKYIKEYININLRLEFKNIDTKEINKIYNDILNNTCSNLNYLSWINKHKKFIIPDFIKNINIIDFKDGINNHYKIFVKFINKYVIDNQKLKDLIFLNNDNKKIITKQIIEYLINDDIDVKIDNYNDWINENKNFIINEFNKSNSFDLDKELEKNPYKFIPYMLNINLNLELNKSKKNYQIIPLRTNLTPKFIPISIDSLVDILDSKYLLDKIKNYYHNDNKKGLILFETYFKFDSKYIKNILKKGYIFSGLIYTNGHQINYIFNSKAYENNKQNFHSKGKEDRKYIKDITKDMSEQQKEEFINKHNQNKDIIKKQKLELSKEKSNIKKQQEKNNLNKILKNIDIKLIELKNNYETNLLKIEEEHYRNLKIEFDKIDKTNETSKKLMNDILEKLNIIFVSDNIYLKHEYDRNYLTLISDYNNEIDIKYNDIVKRQNENENLIKELKNKILKTKNELNAIKKEKLKKSNHINKEYKNNTNNMNLQINNNKQNKKILNRLIDKIRTKTTLLDYETINNKSLTIEHIIKITNSLIKLIQKIYEMKISRSFNNYIDGIGELEIYLLKNSTYVIKETIFTSLKYLSLDISETNEKINLIKLLDCRLNKINKISTIEKEDKNKNKYNDKVKQLNIYSSDLNKLMVIKKKIENEMIYIFRERKNEIIKVDNMSLKTLKILDKMNWVLIDPGMNSLLTMMSKDGKINMSYSKCEYLNKTKRKETLKKIEKIKKEKIIKIENELTKEQTRLKTSNTYKTFNKYFTLKMKIHFELVSLYNEPRLNKLKWYSFINEKRSETDLVNKIKSKFGNDAVLIIGDWSMNKKGVKSISTPNKKFERVLNKNFLMLKINEFRTSIIDNKSELKCENLILKEINYKNMNIKSVYSLEKLKSKNKEKYEKVISNKKIHKILTCKTSEKSMKYINRDKNAVKNMLKIVLSYIKTNKKPKTFVLGTKICNDIQHII